MTLTQLHHSWTHTQRLPHHRDTCTPLPFMTSSWQVGTGSSLMSNQQINKYKNVWYLLRILFIPQENETCKKNGCNVFLEMSTTIFKGSSPNLKEHDLCPEPRPAQSQAPCINSCLWLLPLGTKSSREGLGSCL